MPSGSEQQHAGEKMSPIVKRVAILRRDQANRKQPVGGVFPLLHASLLALPHRMEQLSFPDHDHGPAR